MKTIDVYTYPDGNADKLSQGSIVSRLQPNGRFIDTYVADLIEGDEYHIPEKRIELCTDSEILDRFLRGDILFTTTDIEGANSICVFQKDTLSTLRRGDFSDESELRGLFREMMSEIINEEEL